MWDEESLEPCYLVILARVARGARDVRMLRGKRCIVWQQDTFASFCRQGHFCGLYGMEGNR